MAVRTEATGNLAPGVAPDAAPPARVTMTERRIEFTPTPAVQSACRREHTSRAPYATPDGSDTVPPHGHALRSCRACGLVYADPIDPGAREYFDIVSLGNTTAPWTAACGGDFRDLLTTVVDDYTRRLGRAPSKVLVVGRWMRDFTTVFRASRSPWP